MKLFDKKTSVFRHLLDVRVRFGAGFLVLFDPDRITAKSAARQARVCEEAGVDAILIGTSLMMGNGFDAFVRAVAGHISIPVILFPGEKSQVSEHADAILFLSLVSGRNPNALIGEQVIAAPIIKSMGLEPIPTAYMFIESGNITSAQFISDTRPIPREKPDIAMAHALAGEYLGMDLVYLEAGSGAKYSVPESLIQALHGYISIPMIVGGGIRSPEEARRKVEAGASFIVTGNVIEERRDPALVRAFAEAIHIHGK